MKTQEEIFLVKSRLEATTPFVCGQFFIDEDHSEDRIKFIVRPDADYVIYSNMLEAVIPIARAFGYGLWVKAEEGGKLYVIITGSPNC